LSWLILNNCLIRGAVALAHRWPWSIMTNTAGVLLLPPRAGSSLRPMTSGRLANAQRRLGLLYQLER
jgi:hypothetical protein